MPALLLLYLLGGWPQLAYILPPERLMYRLSEKRSKLGYSTLKVRLECGVEGKRSEETLYLKTPGMVRRERPDNVVDICRGSTCTRTTGGQRSALPGWHCLPYWFFVTRADADGYLDLLRSWKIDLKTDTLARFGGRVAVVLGAKAWEGQKPQLWFDKTLYLPLRLMVPDGTETIEIAWRGWGSRAGGDWFPEKLEVRRGSAAETCTVLEVKSGVDMPDSLFR